METAPSVLWWSPFVVSPVALVAALKANLETRLLMTTSKGHDLEQQSGKGVQRVQICDVSCLEKESKVLFTSTLRFGLM